MRTVRHCHPSLLTRSVLAARSGPTVVAVLLTVVLVGGSVGPAMGAEPVAPAPAPATPGATGLVDTGLVDTGLVDPDAPTAQELEAQRLEAERLDQEVAAQASAVSDARHRLSDLADQAGRALEAYQGAVQQRDAAEAEQRAQQERLAAARLLVGSKQGELGRWASAAYRDGGRMAGYESLMTLVDSASTDDLGQRLVLLQRVGRVRGEVVTTVRAAEAVQRDATTLARTAAVEASQAQERAEAHRAEADLLVAQQRQQIAVLADLLADTRVAADTAGTEAEALAAARAVAEQRRLAALADRGGVSVNRVVGEVGDCVGGDVSRYPNGAIPLSALCPVAPGHYLRADAAHALLQLNAEYQQMWGHPLCLTDSYRAFDSQVELFSVKPDLAAVPGRSNHGWGTAVDLCGGVEVFGSGPHVWMREHAPLFGWFHPSWAQEGGSRPEPWHWEYGA